MSPLMDSSHGTSVDSHTGIGLPGSGRTGFGGTSEDEQEVVSGGRRPRWLQETLRDVDAIGAPRTATRESRPPERFCSYVALATGILDSEPSSYEEAAGQKVWRDAMVEEYASIMHNDVWEVVPRPEGKSVVTSRWLYKVKYAADGSIEKYKARFVARGFSQVEESTTVRLLLL